MKIIKYFLCLTVITFFMSCEEGYSDKNALKKVYMRDSVTNTCYWGVGFNRYNETSIWISGNHSRTQNPILMPIECEILEESGITPLTIVD